MRPLLWNLGYAVCQRFGLPGLVSIGALLLCAGFGLALDRQDQIERETLSGIEAAHTRLQARLGERPTTALPVIADAALPEPAQIPAILDRLNGMADLLKLALPQASYAWIAATATEPAAYEITMAFKARYALVKPFLMMALNAVPSLAIRDLTMRRPGVEQPELDVQVRLALFVREAP